MPEQRLARPTTLLGETEATTPSVQRHTLDQRDLAKPYTQPGTGDCWLLAQNLQPHPRRREESGGRRLKGGPLVTWRGRVSKPDGPARLEAPFWLRRSVNRGTAFRLAADRSGAGLRILIPQTATYLCLGEAMLHANGGIASTLATHGRRLGTAWAAAREVAGPVKAWAKATIGTSRVSGEH
ncbi:hypothetical protein NDU88_010391 [Pleurodeles waltl]|uniref:Uncharacterized protein n=1 Tax=Pleurodeles waltl TaxID=8319 RepID=A0AAV7PVE7_PLEWA|nr:hypothetical protein NDU88_010391 [Pleurodeles waltl]